jgi:ribosomal protein S20
MTPFNQRTIKAKIFMSAISSISSATNSYQTASLNGFDQAFKDLKSIGTALQSGDLSSAQSALTAFQQAQPAATQAPGSQPFGQNSQANTDYKSLTTALSSGDLSAAQKAFTSLKADLKTTQSSQSAHKGHHHHHAASATATPTTATTSTTGTTANSSTTGIVSGLNTVA